MGTPAAFSGDYTDLRFIKTRSVAAITIEIPIEQASAFVAAFGAPVPASGCPVAIARILPSPVRQQLEASVALIEKPKERRSWSNTPYTTQAAIRCADPSFWNFFMRIGELRETALTRTPLSGPLLLCEHIAACLHGGDIDPNINAEAASKWRKLDESFESWQRF